jgi:hypothetical protein
MRLRTQRIVRPLTAVAVIAACAAVAVGTAGCGAGSVIDPVAKAATVSSAAPGVRMTFWAQATSPALPIPLTITGSGAMNMQAHSGTLDFAMALPSTPQITQALGSNVLRMHMVISGLAIYMQLPAAIMSKLPGGGRPWIKLDLGKAAAAMGMPGLTSLANPASGDPSQMLQYLRAVASGVTKVGSEDVAGFQTTHYRGTIVLDRVADLAPAKDRAALRTTIQRLESMANIKQMPVDVWVDGSSLVRQIQIHMTMTIASTGPMTMTMRITMPSYGPQPVPQVPPADEVTDLTSLASSSSSSGTSGF